jgi:hypothetical protein
MFGCVMVHWTSAESATKTEAASPPKRAMRTPAAFLPLKPQPAHHRGGEDAQGDRRPKLLLTLDFTAFEASQTTSGGPPDHALRLTLAVRLVFWFAVDVRASGAGKLVVCVNIIDMHDKTRAPIPAAIPGESSSCSAVTRCSQIVAEPARTSP